MMFSKVDYIMKSIVYIVMPHMVLFEWKKILKKGKKCMIRLLNIQDT